MGSEGAGDMLTEEQIEQARACAGDATVVALCDMALKYLQVQDQEPVGCVLPDGLVLINAFPHLPANTNLYAAPVPAKEDHRESNSNPSPLQGQSKKGLTESHSGAPTQSDVKDNLKDNLKDNATELLKRCQTVLGIMAKENEGAIFNRWPISHEPLRSDAKHLVPLIDTYLKERG
jgi:hypothetical protein